MQNKRLTEDDSRYYNTIVVMHASTGGIGQRACNTGKNVSGDALNSGHSLSNLELEIITVLRDTTPVTVAAFSAQMRVKIMEESPGWIASNWLRSAGAPYRATKTAQLATIGTAAFLLVCSRVRHKLKIGVKYCRSAMAG